MPEDRVVLTPDEVVAVKDFLDRLGELQKQFQLISSTMQPLITLLMKLHQVDPNEYSLTQDGSAFVRKPPQPQQ